MRQHDVKQERVLNGSTFYIRPFGAFKAANMSGEIFSLLMPIIMNIAPLVLGAKPKAAGAAAAGGEAEAGILDIDAEKAAPHLAKATSGISGDKLELLLKTLLIQHKNISVELEGEKEARPLTEDIANELFCGDVQDMFVLAFDVIKVNYSGFFKKLGGPFGKAIGDLLAKG